IKALEDAITDSEAVLSDKSATQKEVNAIEQTLNETIENLEEKLDEPTLTIQSVTDIESVNVSYGTKEKEIDFPSKIELNLDNDISNEVKVKWSLEEKNQFNPNEPGTYKYIGKYELTENVSGNQPEVFMTVNVLKEKVNKSELENSIKSAKQTNNKIDQPKKELSNLIKQAEKVLKDKEASQNEIDEAIKILEKKMSQFDKKESISDKEENEDEIEQAELNKDKQLPSTATNIFNILALGLFLIVIGLLFIRKRTVN